jgi:hypothetical protein
MNEEWLFPNAVVPVDAETTAALVVEIHRLIDVVGGMALAQPAVPDAFGTREGEHPQYVQGWNDCRAEMLKGMK